MDTMGKRKASGRNAMLWAMFCWETLGHGICMSFTLKHTPDSGDTTLQTFFKNSLRQSGLYNIRVVVLK